MWAACQGNRWGMRAQCRGDCQAMPWPAQMNPPATCCARAPRSRLRILLRGTGHLSGGFKRNTILDSSTHSCCWPVMKTLPFCDCARMRLNWKNTTPWKGQAIWEVQLSSGGVTSCKTADAAVLCAEPHAPL